MKKYIFLFILFLLSSSSLLKAMEDEVQSNIPNTLLQPPQRTVEGIALGITQKSLRKNEKDMPAAENGTIDEECDKIMKRWFPETGKEKTESPKGAPLRKSGIQKLNRAPSYKELKTTPEEKSENAKRLLEYKYKSGSDSTITQEKDLKKNHSEKKIANLGESMRIFTADLAKIEIDKLDYEKIDHIQKEYETHTDKFNLEILEKFSEGNALVHKQNRVLDFDSEETLNKLKKNNMKILDKLQNATLEERNSLWKKWLGLSDLIRHWKDGRSADRLEKVRIERLMLAQQLYFEGVDERRAYKEKKQKEREAIEELIIIGKKMEIEDRKMKLDEKRKTLMEEKEKESIEIEEKQRKEKMEMLQKRRKEIEARKKVLEEELKRQKESRKADTN